jgi:hypothetical protein
MYLTNWAKIKKDGTVWRGEYRTKEKTPYHDSIHDSCDYAFSGPEKGILHFMERMTKTPKWKGYMERKAEDRKAKEKARQRLRDAAPDLLHTLKMTEAIIGSRKCEDGLILVSQHDIGCILRDIRAAIAKAEEVKP